MATVLSRDRARKAHQGTVGLRGSGGTEEWWAGLQEDRGWGVSASSQPGWALGAQVSLAAPSPQEGGVSRDIGASGPFSHSWPVHWAATGPDQWHSWVSGSACKARTEGHPQTCPRMAVAKEAKGPVWEGNLRGTCWGLPPPQEGPSSLTSPCHKRSLGICLPPQKCGWPSGKGPPRQTGAVIPAVGVFWAEPQPCPQARAGLGQWRPPAWTRAAESRCKQVQARTSQGADARSLTPGGPQPPSLTSGCCLVPPAGHQRKLAPATQPGCATWGEAQASLNF